MDVTVGICTWNRADLLTKTLERMTRLVTPEGVTWEVLVVNNNCTDDTDEVLERFADALPLRRLSEPRPGKSKALNTAIEQITSDLILWTDDDVLVDERWLAEYVNAARTLPEAAFFGGRITPWFERQPPGWMAGAWQRVAAAYATRDPGSDVQPVAEDWLPFGANFAIRTDVQRQFPYSELLGRIGANDVRGEETDVILKMMDAGHQGFWWPAAEVQHFIPVARMTTRYLRDFYRGIGQTQMLAEGNADHDAETWHRWRHWSKAMFAEARYQVTRRCCPASRWAKDLEKCSLYWGRLSVLGNGRDAPLNARAA